MTEHEKPTIMDGVEMFAEFWKNWIVSFLLALFCLIASSLLFPDDVVLIVCNSVLLLISTVALLVCLYIKLTKPKQ